MKFAKKNVGPYNFNLVVPVSRDVPPSLVLKTVNEEYYNRKEAYILPEKEEKKILVSSAQRYPG